MTIISLKQLNNKYLFFAFLIFISYNSFSQSDFVSLHDRQFDLLNRLELKLRKDSVLNFSTVKPFDRRVVTERLEYVQQLSDKGLIALSGVDKYELQQSLNDNFEWNAANQSKDTLLKLKDIFSAAIKTKPAYIGVKQGTFSAYISPLLYLEYGNDNNLNHPLLHNSRGFYLRGTLTKGLGYYTYFTSNQERDPLYVQQYADSLHAIPGAGYIKKYKTDGFDYYDARGGIMFKITKGIDAQFAYDKVFIGDGYRSLILSDNSSSFLFLKINTRFWKIQYYNLFTQLISTYNTGIGDYEYPKKYMSFHYLGFQINKWLNAGFFEDVMFGRSNGYDLAYLNPVIFYNQVNRDLGSPDKSTVGLTLKANLKKTQLYSQVIINEWVMKEVMHYSRGYWSNKQALQLGAKTIDLFGIKNLDAQFEMNLIRPFVYTHYDSVGSFTNYNQPLAHPMGANLREFIAIFKYQPVNKLKLAAQLSYSEQGLDSAGVNMGSNIFELYNTRPRDYGWHIGTGNLAKRFYSTFTASYEVIPNFFLDANILIRNYKTQAGFSQNTNAYTLGLRWNMARRVFDF